MNGLEGLRALVVDDHEEGRILLLEQLRILGVDGVPAADGAEALRALKAAAYDLIIMDYHMPQMEGPEVISELCGPGWDGPPPPPILGTSAELSRVGVRDRFIQAGASDFLFKPYSIRELQAALLTCLHAGAPSGRE
jgi:CheY-like chemotaxis protein